MNTAPRTTSPACSAKLSRLSASTRAYILQHYGAASEDVEYAEAIAASVMRTMSTPPRWAYELAGPRAGWADMARMRR